MSQWESPDAAYSATRGICYSALMGLSGSNYVITSTRCSAGSNVGGTLQRADEDSRDIAFANAVATYAVPPPTTMAGLCICHGIALCRACDCHDIVAHRLPRHW